MPRSIKIGLVILFITMLFAEWEHHSAGASDWMFDAKAFVCISLAFYLVWKLRCATHNRVINPARARIEQVQLEQERKYEMLPELGKARVDKKDAGYMLTGKAVGWTAITGLSFLVAWPIGIIVGLRGVKGIRDAWGQYNADTKAANERRAKALSA